MSRRRKQANTQPEEPVALPTILARMTLAGGPGLRKPNPHPDTAAMTREQMLEELRRLQAEDELHAAPAV
jgi:hypothetical protein